MTPPRPARVLAGAIGICLVTAIGSTALASGEASTPDPAESAAVDVEPTDGSTPEVMYGAEAVERLEDTDTLDDVAAEAGVEPDELVDELSEDPTLFLTDRGLVGYADRRPLNDTTAGSQPLVAPVEVASLSSKPGAGRTIFLDFDGHETSDSAWAAPGTTIVSAPSGVSGATVFEVWQRVSEDYLPFDVNVTTVDPGPDALSRTGPTDSAYGVRVVISPTYFGPFGPGTLGVAITVPASFVAEVDRPAFVFASGATPVKTIAEAVSHETGHTFGLAHDAVPGQDYYDGHGGWAPIMGRSIDPATPVSQWSKGEYAGATNQEDDLSKIAGYVGYRPDDHGGTTCTSTVVGRTSTTAGVIGATNDRDVFAVDVGSGTLSVTVRPPPGTGGWSNLLAKVTVRNGLGTVVAAGAPTTASSWSASTSATVPAGRYAIEVTPIGWKTASDGFTTYGSLGAYEVIVNGAAGAAAPPVGCRSKFTPIRPTRLVDTRNGIGSAGRVGAGREVVVDVAGRSAVPNDATAAVFSIVAVNPSAAGFVTAYPCSGSVPNTSTLNYVAGQTVANNTIAALSGGGQLCVWTFADTDILVDITGWLGPSGSSRLTAIGPTRVVDTRSGIGGIRLGAGSTMAVDFAGRVPAGSTAVALNVTGVNAPTPGFLTVYPCSGSVPDTSTVNYVAGEARPNNTIVGLSSGRVCIFSDAPTDVLVDLVGSFGPNGLAYQPTAPRRVLDTRASARLAADESVGYSVSAPALGGVQPGAAFVNVTAANHSVPGFVTTFDCRVRRDTSTLNQQVGQAVANGAIVPLSGVQSCAWMSGGGDLIVDLNGWWVP